MMHFLIATLFTMNEIHLIVQITLNTAVNHFSIITTSRVTELSNLLITSFRVVALHEGLYRFLHGDYPIGAATELLLI